jgi:hypothetical protein
MYLMLFGINFFERIQNSKAILNSYKKIIEDALASETIFLTYNLVNL